MITLADRNAGQASKSEKGHSKIPYSDLDVPLEHHSCNGSLRHSTNKKRPLRHLLYQHMDIVAAGMYFINR